MFIAFYRFKCNLNCDDKNIGCVFVKNLVLVEKLFTSTSKPAKCCCISLTIYNVSVLVIFICAFSALCIHRPFIQLGRFLCIYYHILSYIIIYYHVSPSTLSFDLCSCSAYSRLQVSNMHIFFSLMKSNFIKS